LRADANGLQGVVGSDNLRRVDLAAAGVSGRVDSARGDELPINEIWPWFANGILQSTSDGEGSAYTQPQTEDSTIQLPKAVFEPVSAAQSLEASSARGHFGLV
jgi:hypothetical protein